MEFISMFSISQGTKRWTVKNIFEFCTECWYRQYSTARDRIKGLYGGRDFMYKKDLEECSYSFSLAKIIFLLTKFFQEKCPCDLNSAVCLFCFSSCKGCGLFSKGKVSRQSKFCSQLRFSRFQWTGTVAGSFPFPFFSFIPCHLPCIKGKEGEGVVNDCMMVIVLQ